jgi:hypothetical protein
MERDSVTERKLRWSATKSKSAIESESNGDVERDIFRQNVRRGRSEVEREDKPSEPSSGTREHDPCNPTLNADGMLQDRGAQCHPCPCPSQPI